MNTSYNTSLKPIRHYNYERYGKEYYIELRHKIRLKQLYNIQYTINSAKYDIRRYIKEST